MKNAEWRQTGKKEDYPIPVQKREVSKLWHQSDCIAGNFCSKFARKKCKKRRAQRNKQDTDI